MEKIENATKAVLVDIVKLAQKRGLQGENGGWKDFLTVYDKQVGTSLSDPAKRTPEDLLAFLKTFTNPEHLKFFYKVVEQHESVEIIDKKTDKISPEQELVYKTVGHPQYPLNYLFPSHEEGWRVTKNRKKSKMLRCNTMLAVDCEMVLCEDGTEALVRVCVVDRDLQVKLDELVKPDRPVADYRTHITGIASKDLENVTCSLHDVQVSMMKLLARGIILVGHSLNNDLQVLKIDHSRVIDTSFIFKFCNGSNFRRPSLNDLCKSVLGSGVREEGACHDCLEDARAAMKLVLARIEAGDDISVSLSKQTNETNAMKLLCHGISVKIPSEMLLEIVPGDFTIQVTPSKKVGGDKYSALAVFKNKQEADEAFKSLDGEQVQDLYGRPQKLIYFKLKPGISGTLYVRKMVEDGDFDNSNIQMASNKRSALSEYDNPFPSKKVKTVCTTCDDYSKEIESLKKKLSERDQEISMLNKIIVTQVRKQSGL